MKKKIISLVLASAFVVGTSYQAFATPVSDGQKKEIETTRNEYNELNSKISQLESEVNKLTGEMNTVFMAKQENDKKIADLQTQSAAIEKEIPELEKSIAQKEEILGKRISGVYKAGGNMNYLSMLLSSESIGDFLGNINAISIIMKIDNDVIEEVKTEKKVLDDKIAVLQSQKTELDNLNVANEAKIKEFEKMEAEQQALIKDLNKEMADVKVDLSALERPLVKPLTDVINSSSSTKEQIQRAVQSLQGLRNQIVSPDVDKEIVAAIEKGKNRIEELSRPVVVTPPPSTGGGNSSGGGSGSQGGGTVVAPPASNAVEAAIAEGYRHIGKPYVFGSEGPNSFDCSSFTRQAYRAAGIELPRTTYGQVTRGVYVPQSQLRRGDLVFTEGSAGSPSHVGIYLGNGQMIHASSSRGIVVASMYRYVTARRIV
ncbi:MAG: NlpC/P60 family protein [Sarcina sp.]